LLTRLGGLAVVNMLAAFLGSEPGEAAEREVLEVLGLIGEMDEDTAVRHDWVRGEKPASNKDFVQPAVRLMGGNGHCML
jgi:hypothetical protein